MSEPADLAALLAESRAEFEARMTDRCIIRQPPTRGPLGNDGVQPVIPGAVVYDGICWVEDPDSLADRPQAGLHTYIVARRAVRLPISAVGIEAKQMVEITASMADPGLVGTKCVVIDVPSASHKPSRRVLVDEVVA